MKSALIALSVLLSVSAAQAQMNSMTQPGPAAADKPVPGAKRQLTADEKYAACMARHKARERVGKNTSMQCARVANTRR